MKKVVLLLTLTTTIATAYYPSNYHHFNSIWRDFNQHFQQLNQTNIGVQSRQFVDEKSRQYILQLKLNGLDKDAINISHENGFLVIKSDQKNEQKSQNYHYYSASNFYQSVSLPRDADAKNLTTIFANDVLSINIPKLSQ